MHNTLLPLLPAEHFLKLGFWGEPGSFFSPVLSHINLSSLATNELTLTLPFILMLSGLWEIESYLSLRISTHQYQL